MDNLSGPKVYKNEMFRLQGIDPSDIKQVVTDTQIGGMLGNAMSQNVLEALFKEIFKCVTNRTGGESSTAQSNLQSTNLVQTSLWGY